ncbi:pentatricopeptide repeat-containing protein At5g02860 isoform X1 [Selaginella moellendorffii]|nr:pentatricopeptide repeat-containing protein At5g02860 isoform X1 [Selaginella moellendorffii]|eukprot:XP_024544953.1 pentatricopeptide repeat-containing protein At5g02860 isoform X1 [Selaginella moellendorffii]
MAWWKRPWRLIRSSMDSYSRKSRSSIVLVDQTRSAFSSSRPHLRELGENLQGKACVANSAALISFCHRVEDLDEARQLLARSKEQGAKPEFSCYHTLLDGCCKFGSPDELLAVISEMDECGTPPDARAYAFLIASYAKASMLDKASEIFQTLRRKNAGIESSVYSSLVWLYCQADRPKDAEEFLKAMEEDRKDEDCISYNVVISAYQRMGCYSDATRIFQDMKKKKKKETLGRSTYKLMLDVYLKASDHDSFDKLFKEMLGSKVSGEASTLEAAVNLYASRDSVKDAEWLYENLAPSGSRLTVLGYNKLLELFLAAGNTAMVDRIYREMPRVVSPDQTTRRLVMTAFLRAQSFRGAVELHEEILRESGGVQPLLDPQSFALLVRAYVKMERFFEAMKLVVLMRKAGMKVDEEIYEKVVTGMVSVQGRS